MTWGYVVVTINQASGFAEEVDGVWWTAQDAQEVASGMGKRTLEARRTDRHIVCELVEVED